MEIISRSEAIKRGLRRYFTGKPCKDGHMSVRDLQGRCLECRHIKDVAIRRRHYLKYRDRLNKGSRDYYANMPPEKKKAARDRWTQQRRDYAKANRDRERQRRKDYYAENKPRYLSYRHKRIALKHAGGGEYKPADIVRIRKAQHDRCAFCKAALKGKGEIDHIVPLKHGGSSNPKNLQLLCQPCNRAKNARDPIVHARSLGFLL